MVHADAVLPLLPGYLDEWCLINPDQYVPDIIEEVCKAHELFGGYYDCFSDLFYTNDPNRLAEELYRFCKTNITYKEEPVKRQTSALPTGILERGYGDCKHYALFCAGVIASLNRLYGCCFVAEFVFAGYDGAIEPYHVFVSLRESDEMDIWVDPTPGSGGTPSVLITIPV